MIQRVRNYEKQAPSRSAQKIFIVCEGDATEPNYFNFFAGLSSNLAVIPIPPEDGKSDPIKLMEWAQSHMLSGQTAPEYTEHDLVWFVVDTDEWQEQGKIAALRSFCSSINQRLAEANPDQRPYDMFHVAQSNPQFEIWHYYHIYDTLPEPEEVDRHATFKEFVNNQIRGGFDFKVHPVYVEDAILHAAELFARDAEGNPSLYSTEVYLLCQTILPFVKKPIDKMKQKVSV